MQRVYFSAGLGRFLEKWDEGVLGILLEGLKDLFHNLKKEAEV